MKKIRIFGHSLLWVATVSLVTLAILVVLLRFMVSSFPAYKVEVEQMLSEQVGRPVSVVKLSAQMDGFSPQLVLNQVSINQPAGSSLPPFKIGEVRASFYMFDLILGQFKPSRLTIENISLSIKRFEDGHITVEGLASDSSDDASDMSWLMDGGTFEVKNADVIWQDNIRQYHDLHFKDAHIVLDNQNTQHRLVLKAMLPGFVKEPLEFRVRVNGNPLQSNDWQAESYLKARGLNLSRVSERRTLGAYSFEKGSADVQIWSELKQGEAVGFKGHVELFDVSAPWQSEKISLERLSTWFSWYKQEQGWRARLGEFSLRNEAVTQDKARVHVAYQAEGDSYQLDADVRQANLAVLSHWAQKFSLVDEHLIELKEIQPKGIVETLNLSLYQQEKQATWAACGTFKGLGLQAVDQIPGIDNFSTHLCSTPTQGWANVSSLRTEVDAPEVFNNSLFFDVLKGVLMWEKTPIDWRIRAPEVLAQTPDVSTRSRFYLTLPLGEASPFIDVQMDIGRLDAVKVPHYLPMAQIDPKTVSFLNQAFSNGHLVSGSIIMRGDPSNYPYRDNGGVFQFYGDVQQLDLQYAAQWPPVLAIDGTLEFHNETMQVLAKSGTITGNTISHADVQLDDLLHDKFLSVRGKVSDDLSGLYRFFEQSPLNTSISALTEQTKLKGHADINLDLDIGLSSKDKTTVNASTTLESNTFELPSLGLALNNVSGHLTYSGSGLKAKQLTGSVFDQPFTAKIQNPSEQTEIQLVSRLQVSDLKKTYPNELWKNITGESDVIVNVTVPDKAFSGSGRTEVAIESTLDGVTVDLPAPIGKQQQATLPLKIQASIEKDEMPVTVRYGQDMRAILRFAEKANKTLTFDKGSVFFGTGQPTYPKAKGLKLEGHIKTLNVDEWQKVADSFGSSSNNDFVQQVDLNIDELIWREKPFKQLDLTANYSTDGWRGWITHRMLAGQYFLPHSLEGENSIQLNLAHLKLPSVDDLEVSESQSPVKPSEIPNIDVMSEQFQVGDSNFGQLDMQLRRSDDGVLIPRLNFNSERDQFKAKGAWESNSLLNRTGLIGELKSRSLGSMLRESGVVDGIKEMPTALYFDVHWPGEPQNFSFSELSGFVDLKAKQGRLLDAEPGLGRILGLFSLDSIKRRLTLDFSDVVKKGMSFDEAKGRFVLVNGLASLKRFYVESPAARLEFEGVANLADKTIDQVITVLPKTTESLPIAGALAGGPLVGAAVFVVQKLAGDEMNKIAGYQYRVTGTFDDPIIELVTGNNGKELGLINGVLTPLYDATIGQLPLTSGQVDLKDKPATDD